MRYVVWVEQPDGQVGGGAEDAFDAPLVKDSTVEHGGERCLVTEVDETKDPPHVRLRLLSD